MQQPQRRQREARNRRAERDHEQGPVGRQVADDEEAGQRVAAQGEEGDRHCGGPEHVGHGGHADHARIEREHEADRARDEERPARDQARVDGAHPLQRRNPRVRR